GRHSQPFGQLGPFEAGGLEVERELVRGRELRPVAVGIHPTNVRTRRRNGSRTRYAFSAGQCARGRTLAAVLLSVVVETSRAVAATRSRKTKIEVLAATLQACEPDEIATVV